MRALLKKDADLTRLFPALNMRKAGQTQLFLASDAKDNSLRERFPTIGEVLMGGGAEQSQQTYHAQQNNDEEDEDTNSNIQENDADLKRPQGSHRKDSH